MTDTIVTRRAGRLLVENSAESGTLDLTDYSFLSRAAADELLAQADINDVELEAEDDVQKMLDVVRRGRRD